MSTPKKSLGQHWLFDGPTLDSICNEAALKPTDTVLEIGPGLGPLTAKLVLRAKKVIAVELDPDLAKELPIRVPAKNLEVIHQDILQFDLAKLPKGYKVVANVPYYITSSLVRFLLEAPNAPATIVMLVQKEVAQRLAATPGSMSILAVSAQLYATVSLGTIVPAEKFEPAPKVDSQVVILQPRTQPLFKNLDTKQFFKVVKAGYGEKRKTLRNSLAGGLHIPKDQVEPLLQKAKISQATRAQQLDLAAWHRLAKAFTDQQKTSKITA